MSSATVRKNALDLKTKKKLSKEKTGEIKEKLSGKNYSPIVASAKSSKSLLKKRNAINAGLNSKIVQINKVTKLKDAENKPKKDLMKLKSKNEKINSGNPIILKRKLMANEGQDQPKKNVKVLAEKSTKNMEKKEAIFSQPGALLLRKNIDKINSSLEKMDSTKKKSKDVPPVQKKSSKSANLGKVQPVREEDELKNKQLQVPKKPTSVSKASNKVPDTQTNNESSEVTKSEGEGNGVAKPLGPVGVPKLNRTKKMNTKPSLKVDKSKVGISMGKSIKRLKTLRRPSLKSKALRRKAAIQQERGVVIFKSIPHGFYEKQLKAYCSQFGKVTGVYHPVSKKGNSRGYAFVEFAHKEVAEVVAETMNNYVMFYRRLKCVLVPQDKHRPSVFKHEKSNADLAKERRDAALKQRMRRLPKKDVVSWKKRKLSRVRALHKKLADMGADYEFKVNGDLQINSPSKPVKSEHS